MFSSSGPLAEKGAVWTNMTSIVLEKSYKLASLDRDEVGAFCSVYCTLYPRVTETSFKLTSLYKKFMSLTVGREKYGSTAGFRLYPFACILASCCGNDGIVDPGTIRPGSFVTLWFTVWKLKESNVFMPLLL